MSQVRSLGDTMDGRSLVSFIRNLVALADFRSWQPTCWDAKVIAWAALLLALSREKPTSSSILRRCIGMLILPAADMLGLPRRRLSRLGRK
jgi:hypothetical protein